jgi:hypothetical protein
MKTLVKWLKRIESKLHLRLVVLGIGIDVLYTTYLEFTWWNERGEVVHSWSRKFGYDKF